MCSSQKQPGPTRALGSSAAETSSLPHTQTSASSKAGKRFHRNGLGPTPRELASSGAIGNRTSTANMTATAVVVTRGVDGTVTLSCVPEGKRASENMSAVAANCAVPGPPLIPL
eukprot:354266-Chlamydomonas_euryale.AAC.14